MAESLESLSWILPLVFSIVVPFVLLSWNRFTKTSEGTLTGTIKLEGLKTNVDDVRDTMEKGFDKIETMLNRRDEEMRKEFSRHWDRIEQISTKLELYGYRLNQIERTRGKYYKGGNDAVGGGVGNGSGSGSNGSTSEGGDDSG